MASMRAPVALVIMVLVLAAIQLSPAAAQTPKPVVTVAVRVIPPLVEQANGQFTGFSIDLWNAIASRCNRASEFEVVPNVQGQLAAISDHAADVGVGAISITAERIVDYDFSQPILNAGLDILVRSEKQAPKATAFSSLMHLLLSPAILVWLGLAGGLTIIPAHVVWFVERRRPDGMFSSKRYVSGIFEAFFWGLGTLATQADAMPRHWAARLVAVLWMFTGVVFVANYTATLAATLTVQQLKREINGPADLPGKSVATIRDTTSARYLDRNNIRAVTFASLDDAYQALMDGTVNAVVYDAPMLQYVAAHQGLGRADVVGQIFEAQDYGFVFRNNSELRREVDAALLSMRQDGTYGQIRDRWFGKS